MEATKACSFVTKLNNKKRPFLERKASYKFNTYIVAHLPMKGNSWDAKN